MPKINKKVVDALRPAPEGAESFAWDCELRGFGLRVMPSGVASYLVQSVPDAYGTYSALRHRPGGNAYAGRGPREGTGHTG